MSCSNCYNGCTEIVSDKCVKYTGVDIPVLGIKNGDSLSYIEQSLAGFLVSCLDGSGIKPDLPITGSSGISCELVSQYLPTCGDLTINDFVVALIKAACNLQIQVDAIDATLADLNADYSIGCLTGVIPTDDTHAIVQAVIDKLCLVNTNLTALSLDLVTNYVNIADIDSYIAAYLAAQAPTSEYKNKMIPFTAVEYYGPLTGNFDITGAGLGNWIDIYLCNGLHGTPDKRGRVPVGVINGAGGGPLSGAVDPIIVGNPNYSLLDVAGINMITLSVLQMPTHTHTVTVAQTPHSHFSFNSNVSVGGIVTASTYPIRGLGAGGDTSYEIWGSAAVATLGLTSPTNTNVLATLATAGSGTAHANIQPVLACYYIMYIP